MGVLLWMTMDVGFDSGQGDFITLEWF